MNQLFEWLGILLFGIILFVYIGYPVTLFFINIWIRNPKTQTKPITPSVSYLISCYNEEGIIRQKLENALQMDYPAEKIEIIVVSDGSTDRSDEIVQAFERHNVRLLRMKKRCGKTIGLNMAVSEAKGEVIIFSDANAMYEKDAVRKLVRNFSDDKVGYVVGEAKYLFGADGASVSERSYWAYECAIKRVETKLHSVVGGDGAIYAIRKDLYEPLLETDINDFVNPLQIIAKGYRGVYEPEAVCWEETAGSFEKEFRRKSRIVNRSFSGLLRVPSVMNPFKTGIFSFEIISHKLLRWLSPFFLVALFLVSMVLAAQGNQFYRILLAFELTALAIAYACYLRPKLLKWSFFYYIYYFIAVNIASLIGICQRLMGHTQITWNTSRVDGENDRGQARNRKLINLGMLAVGIGGLLSLTSFSIFYDFTKWVFWISFLALLYIYALYPLVLQVWSLIRIEKVRAGDYCPPVTMLVCVYNEEEVIAAKIENSLAIDYPSDRFKVVFASDGSTDGTNEILGRYADPRIDFIAYPARSGKIGAIIKTVPTITTEIIVFSDANAMIEKGAIKKLVRNFNDPSVGVVSSDVIVQNSKTSYGKSESIYYRYERWIQSKESLIHSIIGVDGGLYAMRKALYTQPSPDIILDDFVISMNAAHKGHRLVYDRRAKGFEESENSYFIEFQKKSRVVAGAFQALFKKEGLPPAGDLQMVFCYISHKLLRWLTPLFLIALYISSLWLSVKSENYYLITFTILQTLFYAFASMGLLFSGPIKNPMIHIPFYFCLVNSAALYGIYKALLKKQSVKWQVFSRKQATHD